MDSKKRLAFAICDFLSTSIKNGVIKEDDAEGIEGWTSAKHPLTGEVAIQCIGEAFGIDISDADQQKALSIKPATLTSIFDVFLQTQKKVTEKKEEAKRQAEALKTAGNKLMAERKYTEAIAKYSEAIELDPSNAVYYANRAAAYSQNGDHSSAVEDAKLAVEADPDYSKAYSRMGHAYFCLGQFKEAVDAYERGLRLDPENASMKQSLAAARQKIDGPSSPANSSLPDAGSPAGLDFASMLGNPNFMNMASQMMSNPAVSQMLNNPAVAQMAQNLMQDPSALQNLMSNPELAKLAAGMAPEKK
ncbi:hypothetical protein HDU96_006946 [Phlyctochytrium bullatum]|nr:hypothetical protein HDU96_006946 [Phlyctochytrium bullatum]